MRRTVLVFCVFCVCLSVTNARISLGTILRRGGVDVVKGLEAVAVLEADAIKSEPNGCQCLYDKYDCGCCTHLEIEKVGLNDTVCVNVTYLPEQIGISLLLVWDGKVEFNETVSARNPPPMCVGIPHVKLLDVCVAFYDLDINNSSFHGCVKLEADVYHYDIEDYDLGCFNIPLSKKKSLQHLTAAQLLKHSDAARNVLRALNAAGEKKRAQIRGAHVSRV